MAQMMEQAMVATLPAPPVERKYEMRTTGFSIGEVVPQGNSMVVVGVMSKDGTAGLTKGPACPEPND